MSVGKRQGLKSQEELLKSHRQEQVFVPIKLLGLWIQNALVYNLSIGILVKIFHIEVTANFTHFDAYKERFNLNIIDDRNE